VTDDESCCPQSLQVDSVLCPTGEVRWSWPGWWSEWGSWFQRWSDA